MERQLTSDANKALPAVSPILRIRQKNFEKEKEKASTNCYMLP